MIIYLDESYDNSKEYFIIGALFNPHHKHLLNEIRRIKNEKKYFNINGTFKEIKYNNCYCKENFEIAKLMLDSFLRSTSYFRAVVVKTELLNLDLFGESSEPSKIKWARAYKKFAEMLIRNNTKDVYNGVLLTDSLTRCDGDLFIKKLRQQFCNSNRLCTTLPILKSINDVKSDVESYQVIQVNDLLLGCIINNLIPTKNKWKNDLREYLLKIIGAPSLLDSFWSRYPKYLLENENAKYNVWYWKPKKTT